jgi:non-specific serine/threonine protein kinase/serine/threonine-protein kinase
VGRRVGPYELVREIGRGGMGAVYLATRADDEYRKQVAVKVIRSNHDPEFIRQRFQHERQILADLEHPNIARLIDGGSTKEGLPYFVMEYVDGLPIDRHCHDHGLSIVARLELFRTVCAAVHYAHQHLVVHRDLKAGNILVTAEGVPTLLDFGIAKLIDTNSLQDRTVTVMRVMTIDSASPEQVRGERVTTASDVYALGVLLHRLLSGRGPYDEATTTTPQDLARAICDVDARRPSDVAADPAVARRLRGDLDTIVLKALQKDPARRYSAVDQFADDLSRHLNGRPVLARPDTVRYRATKFISRHKTLVAAAVLLVLSLIGGTVATAWQAHNADLQKQRAERRFNDVRRLANSFLFEFHDAIADLPGSTKARELVVRRAIEYLDSLSSELANDPWLTRELAAAYEKFGDVQGLPDAANLGDVAGSLRSHQRALELRQALVQANPTDTALQRELATTHDHVANLFGEQDDSKAAVEHARTALAIREAVVAQKPDGIPERNSLAIGHQSMSNLMSGLGDFPAALEEATRAAREFEALLALNPSPNAQRNAAIGYKYLGGQLERSGDRAAAVANYRKAIALDEARVSANEHDAQARLDLSFDYASIGYALSKTGDIAASLENYQRALALRERVSAADPNDINSRGLVARAHLSIGNVLRTAGRWPEAIAQFDRGREMSAARVAQNPSDGAATTQLANAYGALAGVSSEFAAGTRDAAQAARLWRDARDWSRKAIALLSAKARQAPLTAAVQSEIDGLTQLVAMSDAKIAAGDQSRPSAPR